MPPLNNHNTKHGPSHDIPLPSRDVLWSVLGLFLLTAIFFSGPILVKPPSVRSDNPSDAFNTNRAMTRIGNILKDQNPHPIGTQENFDISAHLLAEIQNLGFQPTISETQGCFISANTTYIACARPRNISFRMGPKPSAGAKETILLTSHYDSVPAGPGAADAMMGVGVILEIVQQLSKEPLTRPTLILLTDGEEAGLLGAHAFIRNDKRSSEIKTVVNFEARGVTGPAYMFETSQPNGRILPAFIKNASRPLANSLMASIYERLPNSTDVAVYLPEKYEALNFAIIGNERFYHTPKDNMEELSQTSLQHMGDLGLSTMKELTTGIQAEKLNPNYNRHIIYTDFLSRGMIALPQIIALPILLIALICAIAILIMPGKKAPTTQTLSIKLIVVLMPALTLIFAALLGFLGGWLLQLFSVHNAPWAAHSWAWYGVGIMSALTASYLIPQLVSARASRIDMFTASWIWFLLLGTGLFMIMPGGTILFVIPALFFIIGYIVSLTFFPASVIIESLAAIITILLWVPIVATIGEALGYGNLAIISALAMISLLPWLAIVTTKPTALLSPLTREEQRAKSATPSPQWIIPATGLIVFCIIALILPAHSTDRPRHLNIITIADMDKEKAMVTFGSAQNAPLPPAMIEIADKNFTGIQPQEGIFRATTNAIRSTDIPLSAVPSAQKNTPEILVHAINTNNSDDVEIEFSLKALAADRVTLSIPTAHDIVNFTVNDQKIPIQTPASNSRYLTYRCAGSFCTDTHYILTLKNKSHGEPSTPWLIYSEIFGASPVSQPFVNARPQTAIERNDGDRTIILNRAYPFNAN